MKYSFSMGKKSEAQSSQTAILENLKEKKDLYVIRKSLKENHNLAKTK